MERCKINKHGEFEKIEFTKQNLITFGYFLLNFNNKDKLSVKELTDKWLGKEKPQTPIFRDSDMIDFAKFTQGNGTLLIKPDEASLKYWKKDQLEKR